MAEYVYGNDFKVYIDGVLIGTRTMDEDGKLSVAIPKELVPAEGSHVLSFYPVPVQELVDSINNGVKISGFLKVKTKRKKKDDKESKLSRKIRNGWV